jgi:hypothetical protein
MLLGFIIIVYFGSIKPTNVSFSKWKNEMAPIHLGWMVGLGACVFGLFLVLSDAFLSDRKSESVETYERELRETILRDLPQSGMTEKELNQLINSIYGRTGIVGLTAGQMAELQVLIKQRIASPHD